MGVGTDSDGCHLSLCSAICDECHFMLFGGLGADKMVAELTASAARGWLLAWNQETQADGETG